MNEEQNHIEVTRELHDDNDGNIVELDDNLISDSMSSDDLEHKESESKSSGTSKRKIHLEKVIQIHKKQKVPEENCELEVPPLKRIATYDVKQMSEKLKNEGTFYESFTRLTEWLKQKRFSKKNADHLYSLIQIAYSRVLYLAGKKGNFEQDVTPSSDLMNFIQNAIKQLGEIKDMFKLCEEQDAWNELSVTQKNYIKLLENHCEQWIADFLVDVTLDGETEGSCTENEEASINDNKNHSQKPCILLRNDCKTVQNIAVKSSYKKNIKRVDGQLISTWQVLHNTEIEIFKVQQQCLTTEMNSRDLRNIDDTRNDNKQKCNDDAVPAKYDDAVPAEYNDDAVPAEYNDDAVPAEYNGDAVPAEYNGDIVPAEYNGDTVPAEYNGDTVPAECNGDAVPAECNDDTVPAECNDDTVPAEYNNDIVPACNADVVPACNADVVPASNDDGVPASNDNAVPESNRLSQNDARILSFVSPFVHFNPGVTIKVICSYLRRIDSSFRRRNVEDVMRRFSNIFDEIIVEGPFQSKWFFTGFHA